MHEPIPPTPTNPPSEWNFYELWERIKTFLTHNSSMEQCFILLLKDLRSRVLDEGQKM